MLDAGRCAVKDEHMASNTSAACSLFSGAWIKAVRCCGHLTPNLSRLATEGLGKCGFLSISHVVNELGEGDCSVCCLSGCACCRCVRCMEKCERIFI